MNKQQTALKVRDTLRKYKEQGSDSPCRKNHIVLYANNTWEHEKKKAWLCYMILNGNYPYTQDEDKKIHFERDRKLSFITEAVDRRTGKRRDIVILETSQIVEVVNTHTGDDLMEEYEADDVLIIKV